MGATRDRGAAIVEVVIALPILIVIILGAIQFGLIYQAKATLNHAGLQAARAGAVENADPNAIRRGLARGLAPLYSPDSSLADVITTVARINADLMTDARIRILNPTREAFADFGEAVNGVREIPNDRLHARSTTPGAQSGVNIQDANILRVEIMYGYELKVPLVNWFITRTLLGLRGDRTVDAFEQQLLRRTMLPVITTATVRMQTPARMNGLMIALADLPEVNRFDAASRPPDGDEEEDQSQDEENDGDSGEGDDDGGSLDDGFLGFGGGGPADGSGGGQTPPSSEGGGSGGGENSGNPQQCSGDGSAPPSTPLPPREGSPGQSSPVTPGEPGTPFDNLRSVTLGGAIPLTNGATLPGIDLPSLAVGNPIHVATGNKYQGESDITPLPGVLGLEFARHYNSESASRAGAMGAGWRHGYEANLHFSSLSSTAGKDWEERSRSAPSVLLLTQSDGRQLKFIQSASDPHRYLAQRVSDGELFVRSQEPLRCASGKRSAPEQSCFAYRWRWSTGRELTFDNTGQLREIRESNRTLLLHYNDARQLTHVVDPQQRTLHFAYYANGRLKTIHTAHGAKIRYAYDGRGNLEYVINAVGDARRYHYEDVRFPHHLTGVSFGSAKPREYGARDSFARIASWKYDEQGRGVFSSHPQHAGKVTLSYRDGYTDVTDAFGRVSRYVTQSRDGVSIVTEVRGPGCSACGRGDVTYQFNDHFQITEVSSKLGPTWRFQYDGLQRLTNVQRNIAGEIETLVRYRYEGAARQPNSIERPGINPEGVHSIHINYRTDGRPKAIREQGHTPTADGGYAPIERSFKLAYNVEGQLASIDGPREDARDITRFEYNPDGQLIATISPDGFERRVLACDAIGRPIRIRISGVPTIHLQYDDAGRIIAVTQLRTAGELTLRYRYDAAGRLREIKHPDGEVQHIDYDAAGRPSRRSNEQSGLTQAIAFSQDDQVARIALLSRTGAVLRMLHFAYDGQRRLSEIRDGDGPALRRFVYEDEDARPDRVIDQLGAATLFAYDVLGNLAAVTAGDGGVTQFNHNSEGRLSQLIAPNNAQTRYEYDDFGRRVRERSADRGTTHYAYDATDNLIERIDARGERIRFTYTAGNRLKSVNEHEGATTLAYVDGRLSRLSGPWGSEAYKHDADGNLIEHTRQMGDREFTTEYRYDANGRVKQRRLPSGEWLKYEYNENGSLKRIARDQLFTEHTLVGKDGEEEAGALNPLGKLSFGNGLKLSTRVDAQGNLRSRSIGGVNQYRYEYDEAARLIGINTDQANRSYEYDAANRLITVRSQQGELHYNYDANGNRLSSTQKPSALAKSLSPLAARKNYRYERNSNRLLSIESERRLAVRYDAAGNPTQLGDRRYEYNTAGRPTKLSIKGKFVAEYRYNPWGERTSKTLYSSLKPTTTFYIYEQHRLIAEADEQGRVTREYLYLDHHPVALLEQGVPYWIHTDHLGAPNAITDANRSVVWRAKYEPFGLAEIQDDPDGNGRKFSLNLRFPGQYADEESGTYYNIMRSYDPASGRYLTPDPLGAFNGVNSFAYVHSNPVNSFDSLGLYDEMVHYYMTYFLALVAGLPQDIARTMAISSYYIDANPLTRPVNELVNANERALPLYHFVLDYQGGAYGDSSTDPWLRFNNPSSDQLSNLLSSTDSSRLRDLWVQTHPTGTPGLCPLPNFEAINNARYQLYGEYIHGYQDTFAHRDLLNVPYGVVASSGNDPVAVYGGHTGLYSLNPLEYEQPDRTYNQDYDDDPSECLIGDSVDTRRVIFGLSESQCRNRWGGRYTPERRNTWEFNELRTLRMEYEVFDMLGDTFHDEIARNRERYQQERRQLPTIDWVNLAGRSWNDRDPELNARLGVEQSYDEWRRSQGLSELSTVLQRYNASDANEVRRLTILNQWLIDHDFRGANGDQIRIERWDALSGQAASDRWNHIGWIPSRSFEGVLLPRDEQCQPIRNLPGNCDDRPRR